MTVEFLLTSLVIVATPGTGVLYTTAAGLAGGSRAAAIAAVGCTLGIVPHLLAALTGLAALLNASTPAFQALKYLGVAYLFYLAWSTIRDKSALTVDQGAPQRSVTRVVSSGIMVNLLNPKLTIFFFAFLPQFARPGEPGTVARMVELSAVFMALTFVVFVGYGWFAAAVRDHIVGRPVVQTWLRRGFAGAFVALGAMLALT
ncbi:MULTISPECIES: LysE family translocator [Saccharothrix]|uniref:LysE family translocator n=1 Tax=Saccharothrix TaxID=2071 RepID=UPI00093AA8C8|nr:LysE family translocator [Saccharothrix sp. CB00851]OKI16107.1 lysine transporter LysE [Saccharothrix sp. CB00851]